MDQNTRNTLRNVVTQCRRLLEDSVAQVLQGQFGIFAVGKKDEVQIEPEARMSHLSEEDRAYRQDLLDHFEHIKALGYKAKDALAQLIREVAFTHLNRFCAYRMMESRGLIRESVSKGLKSQGFLFYLADHEEDERRYNTGQQDLAYRHFLNWLGGTLSEEIGVLFAPTDPANRLYPPQRVIDEVLGLLNDPELAGIWSEDEAIGWVYQFFIPSDLKDKARKKSSAPQNTYELAFRNQFFTPRYVVEFLVDNTLGRLWLEMRRGHTRLRSVCGYLAFTDISNLGERAKKDPREIRILDPACGSGHFLLYCFDLLLIIYEEAYEDSELGLGLRETYPTIGDLRRDIPRLILTHNLHGIDIDPRATQIAALALWLRCQRAYADMGTKADRPRITRTNVVCAEPMPGDADLLVNFVQDLRPVLLRRVVQGVFDCMQLAAEAGSLLQIEHEIRRSLSEAHQEWLTSPAIHQKELFADPSSQQQTPRTKLGDIKDEAFFSHAESLVVKALEEYARRTEGNDQHRRRLFSTDALRGFAFIDVCRTRFDVILMNPPFGEPSKPSRQYLYSTLPSARQDILAAFIERWVPALTPDGFLGALTNRLILVKDLLHDWRRTFLLGGTSCMTLLADLGYGVLDEAVVEAAAYVLQKRAGTPLQTCDFISLLDRKDKHATLSNALRNGQSQQPSGRVFRHTLSAFRRLPKERIAYWCADQWLRRFETSPCAKDFGVVAKKGLETGKDFELLRLFWEVPSRDLVPLVKWTGYSKGGSYRPLNTDVHLVYDWRRRNDARRTSNEELYGLPGLTYTERTTSNFSARLLPAGNVFSPKGPGIFDTASKCPWGLLGWLNSSVVCFYLELLVGGGDTSAAGTAARDFSPTLIETMPVPRHFRELLSSLAPLTQEMHESLEAFRTPENSWLYTGYVGTSASLCTNARDRFLAYEQAVLRTVQLYEQVDRLVCNAYDLSETEIADVLKYLGHPYPAGTEVSDDHRQAIVKAFSDAGSQNDADEDEDIEDCKSEEVQSRAIAKLSFIADQRYEGLSVRTGLSPRRIADTRAELVGVPEAEILSEARHFLSFAAGVAFNRWAPFPSASTQTDAFAALPCVQPASARNTSDIRTEEQKVGTVSEATLDGILVDDSDHESDIVIAVRHVIETRWGQHGESLESEACDSLGQRTLRDYFRKPGKGGFWDDHISRYSKSRRKAPIYWLLQSSKKNYAIWLYYHRLDKDILFKALVNYVEPKIRLENDRLESLRSQKASGGAGKGAKKLDKEIEKQEDFLSELRDFEEKLRRAADLHLVPDLNDGVVLNIAPLHELVPWKEAEKYWEELLEGKYEWSSIGKQLREKGLVK